MDVDPDAIARGGRRLDEALVPLRSLYGESSGAIVDFIHIEPLRDRSELYDWTIDAHTHAGLHQVVLLYTGGVQVSLDEATHDIVAPAVITIPASVVHSFDYEPHSSGFVLAIAEGQLDGSPIGEWLRSLLFEQGVTLSLGEGDTLVERLRLYASEIMNEQSTVDTGRMATVDWLTRTLLVLVARESVRFRQSRLRYDGSDLFRSFRSAVEAHYPDHWSVGRYAQHLHVSESSLNRICQAVAATTAFEIVQDRLEIEARRRLVYSTAPIHRIASDLGFADPSYFARFFRRRTGLSPRRFRAEHQPVASS
jgi:AraC family transcriptional activator of pobA